VEQDGALTQEGTDVESKSENEQAATAAVRETSDVEKPVAEGKE
jgi:hypothetical protein